MPENYWHLDQRDQSQPETTLWKLLQKGFTSYSVQKGKNAKNQHGEQKPDETPLKEETFSTKDPRMNETRPFPLRVQIQYQIQCQ